MSAEQAVVNAGVTLANIDVINHLLFHKALVDQDEDTTRINKYLGLAKEGEHVSIKDEFDRSIALAFDLCIQEQLNVWDVDLVRFSQLYLKRAREKHIDLVTAGRIILMAWTVLKLQSDDLVRKMEARKEETENVTWDSIPDWNLTGDEFDFTERVRGMRAPIDEKIWHEGDRKVTLMELVDAFEVARQESELRQRLSSERDAFRARIKTDGLARFQGRVHREDLEEDIRLIWNRICALNGSAIQLDQLFDEADMWDRITAFTSVLFLNRDRRIQLWQDQFPYGAVQLRNLQAPGAAPSKEETPAPPKKAKKAKRSGDKEPGDDEDFPGDDEEDEEDDDMAAKPRDAA